MSLWNLLQDVIRILFNSVVRSSLVWMNGQHFDFQSVDLKNLQLDQRKWRDQGDQDQFCRADFCRGQNGRKWIQLSRTCQFDTTALLHCVTAWIINLQLIDMMERD